MTPAPITEPYATTKLPENVEGAERTPRELFVMGPRVQEIVPWERDRPQRETMTRVVARIRELRARKQLALSSSSRPGGARDAHELAELLLNPSPSIESDTPTTDLELVALGVVTLRAHGLHASPAVLTTAAEGEQLEHVVLAVTPDDVTAPEFFDLTRDDEATKAPQEKRFEPITQVEAIGLHHARLAGLYFILDKVNNAAPELDLAMKLAPELATPYYVRALIDARLGRHPERVLSDLSRVSLRQSSPEIKLLLGRAMRALKRFDAADATLSLVPSESAHVAIAHQERAIVACHQGDTDMFFEHISAARSADPSLWEAHRDAALVSLARGFEERFRVAIAQGQRAAPEIKAWDILLEASREEDSSKRWSELLKRRQEKLGPCAYEPPTQKKKTEEERSGE